MEYRIYVPTKGHPAVAGILPGSGIVGRPRGGSILADYEGNRFNGPSLAVYADRVHHAAGRAATGYPTVARSLMPADALTPVAFYDDQEGQIVPDDAQAEQMICAWLGAELLDAAQLRTTGASHERRREIRAALASHNPAVRLFARREAERIGLL